MVSFALALVVAPNAGAALAGDYATDPTGGIAMPQLLGDPNHNYNFGSQIVNAGTPGNGSLLLVGVPDANNGEGAIVFVNPATGETQRIDHPLEPSHIGKPTRFGASVAVIPDIGHCTGSPCTASPTPDGVPDFVVGAPGADIRDGKGVDMGIVYVYDGASRALMKRIQIGPRPADASTPVDGAPLDGTPGFGAAVSSASGMPPCAGSAGIGPCPAIDARAAKGDIDGDGVPDIVIGAPDFQETQDSDPSACGTTTSCAPTGRVYVISGKAIAVPGGPVTTTDSGTLALGGPITYPYPAEATDPPRFGGSVGPVGDVGSCDTTGLPFGTVTCPLDHVHNTPDGVPDLLVSATGADFGATADAGAALIVDGANATVISRLDGGFANARFGSFSSGEYAFGDLVDSGLPDIYVSAPGIAKGYVFTGDGTFPEASRLWAETPLEPGGFGVSSAPAGDIAGDSPGELLIGDTGAGAVHVFSACANQIVQTIGAPGGAGGFGAAVVSAGDVNGDGYPDFAVGAPATAGGEGRVYVMKSNSVPGPDVIPCHPGGGGGGGGGGTGGGQGGSGGGGTTTPPSGRRRTAALALRRLSFATNKKKVKVGGLIKFTGTLRSTKKKAMCQRRQKVAIQRLTVPTTYWVTIDVAVTTKDGKFDSSTTPAPANTKFLYRARVNRTKRCAPAMSNKVRVRATP